MTRLQTLANIKNVKNIILESNTKNVKVNKMSSLYLQMKLMSLLLNSIDETLVAIVNNETEDLKEKLNNLTKLLILAQKELFPT